MMQSFIASLTEAEKKAMSIRGFGLPVRQLSLQQRDQIRQYALYFRVQRPLESVAAALSTLQEANQDNAAVGFDPHGHLRLLKIPSGKEEPKWGKYIKRNSFLIRKGSAAEGGLIFNEATQMAGESRTSILSGTKRLANVVQIVNQARPLPEGDIRLDTSLHEKPLTISGLEYTSSRNIARALSVLFGLALVQAKDGAIELKRRTLPNVGDASQLTQAVRTVVPEPYQRALHIGALDAFYVRMRATERAEAELTQLQIELTQLQLEQRDAHPKEERINRITERIVDLQTIIHRWRGEFERQSGKVPRSRIVPEAVRFLLPRLEERLRTTSQSWVAIAELSSQEKQSLATILLKGTPRLTELLLTQLPDKSSEIDDIILTGGVHENPQGETVFSIFLGRRTVGGYLSAGSGSSNIPIITPSAIK